ncbi:MAG: hypothetical protein U0269_33675 [Polyangiales bacterium]
MRRVHGWVGAVIMAVCATPACRAQIAAPSARPLRAAIVDARPAPRSAPVAARPNAERPPRSPWWLPRCATQPVSAMTRSGSWRPADRTLFAQTLAWISERAMVANEGLPYVEATVETFAHGPERVRGWLLNERYFSSRSALLTWAGVVLPVIEEHGAADVALDAQPVLAGQEHPGFQGDRWFAPRVHSPTTEGLLLRAGLRARWETPLLRMHRDRARLARSMRGAPAAARSALSWSRLFDANYLAATLRATAVYAHGAGDHEAAARYLRSLDALCSELVPMGLDAPYGPAPSATCHEMRALLEDNEERLQCASAPRSHGAPRALIELDRAQWSGDNSVNALRTREQVDELVREVGVESLIVAYENDQRFSRSIVDPVGYSHPPPPSVLRVHRLAYRALVHELRFDCESDTPRPPGVDYGTTAHRRFCAAEFRRRNLQIEASRR